MNRWRADRRLCSEGLRGAERLDAVRQIQIVLCEVQEFGFDARIADLLDERQQLASLLTVAPGLASSVWRVCDSVRHGMTTEYPVSRKRIISARVPPYSPGQRPHSPDRESALS